MIPINDETEKNVETVDQFVRMSPAERDIIFNCRITLERAGERAESCFVSVFGLITHINSDPTDIRSSFGTPQLRAFCAQSEFFASGP